MTAFVALYIWYSEKSLGVRRESFKFGDGFVNFIVATRMNVFYLVLFRTECVV